ncbi:MAG: N-6 DNA methylase [Clostridia bacterium]|nr:N-6 DNA methylase [Clostridia bacterium]
MEIKDIQKQTNINIQEKANLIWNIATHLVGLYKPHEYGNVILPFTVLKRFDDILKKTKSAVVAKAEELKRMPIDDNLKDTVLRKTSGYDFYNTSKFDFEKLLADSENIESNFNDYLIGFSDNVKDIIANFKLADEVKTLAENGKLFIVIQEFNSVNADMSLEKITSTDMGYVFEELIRKFSESYDEQAGAHFTARDIIYLMAELLIAPEKHEIEKNGCAKTAYDMAMGTSQMLGCLEEKLKDVSENADLMIFGQELNPQTYAIAKADALIKGYNASNMKQGDTLDNDGFSGYTFDYIISNPPFGIDWKSEEKSVKEEYAKQGYDGRFGPGLPAVGDGQMLFMLNGVKKLKDTGRMAIIQNGSSLFNGDAGSGPSNIRKYLIENDLLECIVQLPNDLFYNTGIATYIWVITKSKSAHRMGKVQLIDASKCFVKRRKNIGNKRVDLDDDCISLIIDTYNGYSDGIFKSGKDGQIVVESKIFDNAYFGYTKVSVETAETDENGNEVLKKGKRIAAKGKTDSEIVPLTDDIDAYFEKNVLPFNKHAFMDRSKDKIGYEIPFTRIFYKFVEPRKSEEIFAEFKALSEEESKLMKEILG